MTPDEACSLIPDADLISLWHLSRTALSGKPCSRYDRLLWVSSEYSKEHPEFLPAIVYKVLDRKRICFALKL